MQFLTKSQKLDGFRALSPVRVGARVSAYACPDIFCTSLESAHQYGAWRAGERPVRPARAAGGAGGRGARPVHPREPFFEPSGLSQETGSAEAIHVYFSAKRPLRHFVLPSTSNLFAFRAFPTESM